MAYSNEEIDASLVKMHSTGRVRNFIRNAERRKDTYAVQSGHRRIEEILSIERSGQSDFYNELMRYVEAYEVVLTGDVGRRRFARYTRRKIATHGALKPYLASFGSLQRPTALHSCESESVSTAHMRI